MNTRSGSRWMPMVLPINGSPRGAGAVFASAWIDEGDERSVEFEVVMACSLFDQWLIADLLLLIRANKERNVKGFVLVNPVNPCGSAMHCAATRVHRIDY